MPCLRLYCNWFGMQSHVPSNGMGIKYHKVSYRVSYRSMCIEIHIVSWGSVSLHPYPVPSPAFYVFFSNDIAVFRVTAASPQGSWLVVSSPNPCGPPPMWPGKTPKCSCAYVSFSCVVIARNLQVGSKELWQTYPVWQIWQQMLPWPCYLAS